MRTYAGRIPCEDDGWRIKAEIMDGNQKWFLFERAQTHTEDWVTYKVVADGRVEKKANYWCVRNIVTGQNAYPTDMELMRQNRPNLFKLVGAFL